MDLSQGKNGQLILEFFENLIEVWESLVNSWFNIPINQVYIFILSVSASVLFEGLFSLGVSLRLKFRFESFIVTG